MKPTCMALLGFWLCKGFFVTSAHWVKKIDAGAPRKAVVDDMMELETSMVIISERNTSEAAGESTDFRSHFRSLTLPDSP